MLNSDAKKLIDASTGLAVAEHEAFELLAEPVDVIKAGNLLRRVRSGRHWGYPGWPHRRQSRAAPGVFVALEIAGQPEIHGIVTEGCLV